MRLHFFAIILTLLIGNVHLYSQDIQVSLITCSPGKEIYELEGHTALRIKTPDYDMAVNYGIFDFNSPNFIYRFVKGETDYMVQAYPFAAFLNQYKRESRQVTEQPLNLTQDEARKLIELIQENLLPENRVYRYNYVKDNCATRPIAIIEKAMGEPIRFGSLGMTEGWTFRDMMRYYHRNYPWYQFGIDLALGKGIDYPLSEQEKTFAPHQLMIMMESATVTDSLGKTIPAITETDIIWNGSDEGGPSAKTPWYLTPLFIGCLVLLLTLAIVIRDVKRKKISRWYDAVIFSIMGLAGLLLAFLVFVSVHEATSPNYLLIWLNPFCFIVPACIFIKRCAGLLKFYEFLNFVALIILAVLWHWIGQHGNVAFIPLVLSDFLLSARYLYITRCVANSNND